MSSRRIAVCLEVCPTMTFASALDWPGWCRAGGDEAAALRALAGYAACTRKLGVKFRPPAFNDIAAIEELCEATAAVVGAPSDGSPVGAQRLDHALCVPPDHLARPRACLGDAGPGGELGSRLGGVPPSRARPWRGRLRPW
ncbi:MAG TPA: hypothetical protein VGM60_05850 [Pseudonocardia sp.]|jgi:hypothetical protein|uniref:hypothetical protein n=1 Tax=Pseudonocardia sp. TaxID=60912 RepID=UPI002F40E2FE